MNIISSLIYSKLSYFLLDLISSNKQQAQRDNPLKGMQIRHPIQRQLLIQQTQLCLASIVSGFTHIIRKYLESTNLPAEEAPVSKERSHYLAIIRDGNTFEGRNAALNLVG